MSKCIAKIILMSPLPHNIKMIRPYMSIFHFIIIVGLTVSNKCIYILFRLTVKTTKFTIFIYRRTSIFPGFTLTFALIPLLVCGALHSVTYRHTITLPIVTRHYLLPCRTPSIALYTIFHQFFFACLA